MEPHKASFARKSLSVPIFTVSPEKLDNFVKNLAESERNQLTENEFTGKIGSLVKIVDANGLLEYVVFGLGSKKDQHQKCLFFGDLPKNLPPLNYHIIPNNDINLYDAALAWLLGSYEFSMKSNKKNTEFAKLVCPDGLNAAEIEAIAHGAHIAQDLINTPANIMNPYQLKDDVMLLTSKFNAKFESIEGGELKQQNFPLIHAVGQAGRETQKLIDFTWGSPNNPKVTIVGKGVCFDTGGLNIKPGTSMGLMKKDMGGAANALGLASMIMENKLPVFLRVLLPIVENSINELAIRPGDVYKARNGLTVEINNTDAEGRLILADALAYAAEDKPELIISLATLTGAARVALGQDLMPIYSTNADWETRFLQASKTVDDPLWPMPFYEPYESMIESDIADLDNAPSGGFAGSITAALFLKRFVKKTDFSHFDIYGWNTIDRPGRPKGGSAQAIRAIYHALKTHYGR